MLLRVTAEQVENSLGSFFGKIGKFFIDIFNKVIDAFDKSFPHEFTIILLITIAAFLAIYIFTQKINK